MEFQPISFDPNSTPPPRYLTGAFPGNLVEIRIGNMQASGSIPINTYYRIHESAAGMIGNNPESEDGAEEYDAAILVGKKVEHKTIWLNTKGESWRNRDFVNYFVSLGYEFKTDENGNVIIDAIPSIDDVFGAPLSLEVILRENGGYKNMFALSSELPEGADWTLDKKQYDLEQLESGKPINFVEDDDVDLPDDVQF